MKPDEGTLHDRPNAQGPTAELTRRKEFGVLAGRPSQRINQCAWQLGVLRNIKQIEAEHFAHNRVAACGKIVVLESLFHERVQAQIWELIRQLLDVTKRVLSKRNQRFRRLGQTTGKLCKYLGELIRDRRCIEAKQLKENVGVRVKDIKQRLTFMRMVPLATDVHPQGLGLKPKLL